MTIDILKTINSLRDSNPSVMIPFFMEGQCYSFYLFLRTIEPKAEAWYDHVEGHVYTKINKYWYDIRGIHYKVSEYCIPLNPMEGHRPHRWSKSDNRILAKEK